MPLAMPDTFRDIASKYHARAQYHPIFFERLARELKLRSDSRLLDAGCGGGELAKGFSLYVGEVVALDKSEEMLEVARANAAANIEFRKGEVGDCDIGRFDVISVGRALRYMPREQTVKYFESVLPSGGAVVTCTAGVTNKTPWKHVYDEVRWQYGYRPDAFSFKDTEYFAASRLKYFKSMRIKNRAEYTLDLLTENALAYRSSYERISSNIRQFRDDLATALRPYIGVDGSLEGVVGSAVLIFKKTWRRALRWPLSGARNECAGGDGFLTQTSVYGSSDGPKFFE